MGEVATGAAAATGAVVVAAAAGSTGAVAAESTVAAAGGPWPWLQSVFVYQATDAGGKNNTFLCQLCIRNNSRKGALAVDARVRAHSSSKTNLRLHVQNNHPEDLSNILPLFSLKKSKVGVVAPPPLHVSAHMQRLAFSPSHSVSRSTVFSTVSTNSDLPDNRHRHQQTLTQAYKKEKQVAADRLIMEYITGDMLPFRTVESERFRALVQGLSTLGTTVTPRSRPTFMKQMNDMYDAKKSALVNCLAEVREVATTADMWSAHNK